MTERAQGVLNVAHGRLDEADAARIAALVRGQRDGSEPGARPRVFPSSLPCSLLPLAYARELPPLVGVRRIEPAPLRFFASADWLTLGRAGLRTVLDAAENRGLMRHFRRVAVPSESFFASVLLGNPSLIVERDNRRFYSFEPGAPHPATLETEDFDRLLASGADFARKFDATLDPHVLDLLDEHRRS